MYVQIIIGGVCLYICLSVPYINLSYCLCVVILWIEYVLISDYCDDNQPESMQPEYKNITGCPGALNVDGTPSYTVRALS